NLLTWYYGIPSSSSHAIIGGLCGASAAYGGMGVIKGSGLLNKVILPMIISPILGITLGFFFMLSLYWILANAKPGIVSRVFSKFINEGGIIKNENGTYRAYKIDEKKTEPYNLIEIKELDSVIVRDIQKSLTGHELSSGEEYKVKFHVPPWVIFSCAIAMAFG